MTPNSSSTQIDVLIVDANKPSLFKDGDLLIVTPDAVLGVIEVKTELRTKAEMLATLTKLSRIEEACRDVTGKDRVWTGLFVFEGNSDAQKRLLQATGESYNQTRRVINCIASARGFLSDTGVEEQTYTARNVDLCGIPTTFLM